MMLALILNILSAIPHATTTDDTYGDIFIPKGDDAMKCVVFC